MGAGKLVLRRTRRVLLTMLLCVGALVGSPAARGAEPAGATIDHEHPVVTWSGTTTLETFFVGGLGCQTKVADPTCDFFALTIPELTGTSAGSTPGNKPPSTPGRGPRSSGGEPLPDDVLIELGGAVEGTAEYDLFVYDAAGHDVGHSANMGAPDAVVLRDPVPGTYTVAVQAVQALGPSAQYNAKAMIVEADDLIGYDRESYCGLDDEPALREFAHAHELNDLQAVGNPTVALDSDADDNVDLDVLVILDGIGIGEGDRIMRGAAESYAPLHITLRPTYMEHSFAPLRDGLQINHAARLLLGGRRPAGVDIVEVLTDRDVTQGGLPNVVGVADCIGGVAYADRAFVTVEGATPENVDPTYLAFGIASGLHFGERLRADASAHEIGHLMGGQHHYANCVEGTSPTDVHVDQRFVDVSPGDLMCPEADFTSEYFGVLNGLIVRASANRYARP